MIEIKFIKSENKVIAINNEIEIGECEFIIKEKEWNIVHTFVLNDYRGQNIAQRMVEFIIEESKKENKDVIADCSYAKKILSKRK